MEASVPTATLRRSAVTLDQAKELIATSPLNVINHNDAKLFRRRRQPWTI